jgi:RimJ/RimL family protein N-acetyltransferase
MISRHLPSAEHPYREMFAMILKESERPDGKPNMVGSVGIPRVTADAVEVGYGVNADYWGMGYAPEAVKLFVHYYWNIRSTLSVSSFSDYGFSSLLWNY